MKAPRGQAMVLFALTMLLVVVMACITVSIAVKTRERLEQQTLADTIAYSNAVAAARTYNTLSLINRTAVAHWVSLMAVQANVSWATLHKIWFEAIADALGRFDPPGAPQNACAAQRQRELRAARHSLFHAALSSYNSGAASSDDVHLGRGHDPGCTLFDERTRDPRVRNFGASDEEVAQETRRIYGAIRDLTEIQNEVYDELERRVRDGRMARDLVMLARGKPSLGPYRFLKGAPNGDGPAWQHVSNAVGRGVPEQVRRDALVPLAHAAMGSRPSGYLVGGSDETPPPPGPNRLKPPWTIDTMKAIEDDLNGHYGAGSFRFTVEHFAVRTWLGADPETPGGNGRVHAGRDLGFGNVAGGAWARIRVDYVGPCGNPFSLLVEPGAELMLNRRGTSRHQWGDLHAANAQLTDAHRRGGNFCHPGHRRWGDMSRDDHFLQGGPNDSIWPNGFGFVFPQSRAEEARFPVYGQPVMPLFLARSYRPNDSPPDPWNLTFRLDVTGAGSGIDTRAGRVFDDQLSLSTAVLYYHRRRPPGAGNGHADQIANNGWHETPNLLNPYWHATLVRSDLGERGTRTAPAVDDPRLRLEHQMLQAEGFLRAAEAYRELHAAGFRSWQ